MPARATSMPPARPAAASEAPASSITGMASSSTASHIAATSSSSTTAHAAATPSVASNAATAAAQALSLPTLQAESPRALAARAEQLPPKASAALRALARLPRVRGIILRGGRDIAWERMGNQETALGYTRGQESVVACASCQRQARPFVKCVTVQGRLSGACTNCHYGSGSCRCSFRECFSIISFISNCLQVNPPLQPLLQPLCGVPIVLRPVAEPLQTPMEYNSIAKSRNCTIS